MMTEPTRSTETRACCGLQPLAGGAGLAPRLPSAERWVTLVPAVAGTAQSLAQPWQLLHPLLASVLQPAATCLCKMCFASLGEVNREEDPNKELY